jgi:stress response protein YsnF
MAKKIVALYDDWNQAQAAVDDLTSSGFKQSQVKLIGKEDVGEYSKYVESEPEGAGGREEEGFFSSLWHSLFGSSVSERDATYYGEGARRGGTVVTVDVSEEMVEEATGILNRHDPVDVDQRATQWREAGWSGYTSRQGVGSAVQEGERRDEGFQSTKPEGDEIHIPVAEEKLHVGKREAETGGVRVHTFVENQPVEKEIPLREEHVRVERHPVDRKVDERELEKAFEEEDFELKETREVPVLAKEAHIVEEVALKKDIGQTSETVRDTVRHTGVEVDQQGGEGEQPFDADRDYFEKDYNSNYARLGGTYQDYAPAYQYGHRQASDARYQGRRWEDVEPEIKSNWESEHRGTWDKFKAAVRHGWNRMTGSR